jgi:hypothetical protein
MHQAHVGVYRDRHRAPGHLRVAVGDRDRVLFVQADEHLRITVAAVVHQAVVEPAVTRAGDERDVPQAETAQELGHRVAAPLDRGIAALDAFGIFRQHASSLFSSTQPRGRWHDRSKREGHDKMVDDQPKGRTGRPASMTDEGVDD